MAASSASSQPVQGVMVVDAQMLSDLGLTTEAQIVAQQQASTATAQAKMKANLAGTAMGTS